MGNMVTKLAGIVVLLLGFFLLGGWMQITAVIVGILLILLG